MGQPPSPRHRRRASGICCPAPDHHRAGRAEDRRRQRPMHHRQSAAVAVTHRRCEDSGAGTGHTPGGNFSPLLGTSASGDDDDETGTGAGVGVARTRRRTGKKRAHRLIAGTLASLLLATATGGAAHNDPGCRRSPAGRECSSRLVVAFQLSDPVAASTSTTNPWRTSHAGRRRDGGGRGAIRSECRRGTPPSLRMSGRDGGKDRRHDEENGGGDDDDHDPKTMGAMRRRIDQLEEIVAAQSGEIRKLRQECRDWGKTAASIARVLDLLRRAGLDEDSSSAAKLEGVSDLEAAAATGRNLTAGRQAGGGRGGDTSDGKGEGAGAGAGAAGRRKYQYADETEIFGGAPSSVIDAADAAGASILAATLAGKLRMLVDVRDAELSADPDMLVQFVELAVLPVAAGLEGLVGGMDDEEGEGTAAGYRNRVKIVFPTVTQLMQYRKGMALSAPDVVALSVLGFNCVEERDNVVVFIGPSPDDERGMEDLLALLDPPLGSDDVDAEDPGGSPRLRRRAVVVLNHHMLPVSGLPVSDFEVVYHLRLLSVQYMTGDGMPEFTERMATAGRGLPAEDPGAASSDALVGNGGGGGPSQGSSDVPAEKGGGGPAGGDPPEPEQQPSAEDDAALEAAMEHAFESGVHQGFTRAMVIRAYPRPWHVFVDTSPDADADFEVAATFDEEPSPEEVKYAIVECLEGSEREDEIVAQQMQAALEAGQLNRVSEMLGYSSGRRGNVTGRGGEDGGDGSGDDDDDFDDWDFFDAYDTT